jgi:hypothetical protein
MELSRRRLFVASGAVLLAACGDKSSDGGDTSSDGGGASGSGGPDIAGRAIISRFPNDILVPGPQRLPISMAEPDGGLALDGPETLEASLVDADDKVLATLTATRRSIGEGTPPYWTFRTAIDAPGTYRLAVDGLEPASGFLSVLDPAAVTVPVVGSALRPFDTPTVADPRGVEPFCSRLDGPCPLHEITLTEALASGKPVVYMVGTPAHCQTATCAPGLEFVMVAAAANTSVSFVHADVYADNAGTVLAPAVEALGILYEPVLYVCDANGTVIDRLDAIWDQAEVDEAVALVA